MREKDTTHSGKSRKATSKNFKKSMQNRLQRIGGQIRGINRMINEDVYCDEVLNQVMAVESALLSVRNMVFREHLESYVLEEIRKGNNEIIDDLMKSIKRMGL